MKNILLLFVMFFATLSLVSGQLFFSDTPSSRDKKYCEELYAAYKKDSPEKIQTFLTAYFAKYTAPSANIQKIASDIILADNASKQQQKFNQYSTRYYTEAIKTAENLKGDNLILWCNTQYAFYLYTYRKHQESFSYFMTALEKTKTLTDRQIINPAETFKKISYFLSTSGEYAEAENLLLRARKSNSLDHDERANIADALGICYISQQQFAKAEKYFNEALLLSRKNGDLLRYAKSTGNIGIIRMHQKKYNEAIQLLQKDIEISARLNNPQNLMYAQTAISDAFLKNRDTASAEKNLLAANQIAETNPYFKSSELEIKKLLLKIAVQKGESRHELELRRAVEQLELALQDMDGKDVINQVGWETQKNNLQLKVAAEKAQREKESLKKTAAIVICFLLAALIIFTTRLYRNRIKLRKADYEKKLMNLTLDRIKSENKLHATHRTLESYRTYLSEKNRQIEQLETEISLARTSEISYLKDNRQQLETLLESHLMTSENWENFKKVFQQEYPKYMRYLQENFPDLTDSNMRIILLTKLELTNQEIGRILAITVEAVKKSKQRLRKKYGDTYELLFSIPENSKS